MASKTLTKVELVDATYKKIGRGHAESRDLVETILSMIKKAIKKDGALLVSGFCKLEAYAKKARPGRNPQTNETVILPARKVVVFRLSRKFRDELNPQE